MCGRPKGSPKRSGTSACASRTTSRSPRPDARCCPRARRRPCASSRRWLAEAELPRVDVAIAGGGPVGSALALALAGGALSVARIADDAEAAERPIAPSRGSRLILERMGAWGAVGAVPIETIHVSQQGFGRTVMRCSDYGLPALGSSVASSELLATLADRTAVVPGTLLSWEPAGGELALELSSGGSRS